MGVEVLVPAAELRPAFGEYGFVPFGCLQRRLVRSRPEDAARYVTDITEGAPVVTGTVFTPSRHRHVFPSTVATAGVGDHDMISSVGQKLHLRYGRIGGREDAYRLFLQGLRSLMYLGERCRVKSRGLWQPLLKQQHGRLEHGIRLEPFLHGMIEKQTGEGEKAHPLVMGHEGSNHGARLAAGQVGWRVVDGFIKTVLSLKTTRCQIFKIPAGLLGRHHERQYRGIGCNNQLRREPAFETQAGHAKGFILIVEMAVDHVVA